MEENPVKNEESISMQNRSGEKDLNKDVTQKVNKSI